MEYEVQYEDLDQGNKGGDEEDVDESNGTAGVVATGDQGRNDNGSIASADRDGMDGDIEGDSEGAAASGSTDSEKLM